MDAISSNYLCNEFNELTVTYLRPPIIGRYLKDSAIHKKNTSFILWRNTDKVPTRCGTECVQCVT